MLLVLIGTAVITGASTAPTLLTTEEALALARPEPDHRISYGAHALTFGELRLPDGEGPFPVILVLHGGCWLAEYDLGYISGLSARLTEAGFATWSIEYRRVGDEGGGWPGTFADAAAAADALRELAASYPLDLDHAAVVGHSAGGHLALWLAARPGLDPTDPLRGADPVRFRGVVSLAGITDLAAYSSSEGCGSAVPELLGGEPAEHPERLARTSPVAMPSPGVPTVLVIGGRDPIVPRSQAEVFADRKPGDAVEIIEIPDAGHFELIDPSHAGWSAVHRAVLDVLAGGDRRVP
jgi:acetyl esterase/lipase